MTLFLFLFFLQGCEKEQVLSKPKASDSMYEEIGHTVTVSRNGYTYTCTNMGNFHVKCVGPPLEENASPPATKKQAH